MPVRGRHEPSPAPRIPCRTDPHPLRRTRCPAPRPAQRPHSDVAASSAPPSWRPVDSPHARSRRAATPPAATTDDGLRLLLRPRGQRRRPVLWMDSGDLKAVFIGAVIDAFGEQFPEVTTKYDGSGWDQVNQVVPLGIRNGSAPDVFALPQNVPAETAINEGWVQPSTTCRPTSIPEMASRDRADQRRARVRREDVQLAVELHPSPGHHAVHLARGGGGGRRVRPRRGRLHLG